MKKSKLSILLTTTTFILMLLCPLAKTQLTGSDYSAAEKRNLAAFPDVFLENRRLNPNLLDEFTSWFSDHIGYRQMMVDLTGKIKFYIFKQSPTDKVHIGKDGWFYYTDDYNLEIATGEYPLSQRALDEILQTHLAIEKQLKEKDIEYVIVMPCSKVSIYPEYLRYGDGEYRRTPVDIVADYLEQNSDLKVVRTKEALITAKEYYQVFFKTDTHWTQAGAYVAYQEIIKNMQNWGLCNTPLATVKFVESEFVGEFGAMMGSHDFLGSEPTLDIIIDDRNAVHYYSDTLPDGLKQLVADEKIINPCYYYENPSIQNGRSVLMFGDSMFGGWNATNLLAENFSEFTYIWNGKIHNSIVDYQKPDIVIYEVTERYLSTIPTRNVTQDLEPLDDYRSEILDWHFEEDDLIVHAKNISSVSWDNYDKVRCVVFMDGKDTGLRADLHPGKVILPNDTVEFHFKNVKSKLNGTVEIGMAQEGIRYFPDRVKIETIVQN